MKALLVIGGEKPSWGFFEKIESDYDVIAAADSGLDYLLERGKAPFLMAGDMDSLRDPSILQELKNTEIIRASRYKDETDTELAMEALRQRGYHKITLYGGGGGRIDHIFALKTLFEQENPPLEWFTAREGIILVNRRIRLGDKINRRVSLFPVGPVVCRLRSRGLRWPLDELVWDRRGFGISNEVISEDSFVEPKEGTAILIYDLDSEDRG